MLLVVLAALALAQVMSFSLILSERKVLAAGLHRAETFRRVAGVINLLEETGGALEAQALVSTASTDFVPVLNSRPKVKLNQINETASTELAILLNRPKSDVRVASADIKSEDRFITIVPNATQTTRVFNNSAPPIPPPNSPTRRPDVQSITTPAIGNTHIIVSVKLGPGKWLNTVARAPATPTVGWPLLVGALVGAIALAAGTFWATSQVTQSLQGLAEAAAVSDLSQALPETGPKEVSTVAAALNDMKRRLYRSFEEQRELLRAVGHDLRTPITSLRIRAEFITDLPLRERMLATLDHMERLTSSAIEVARGGSSGEPVQTLDLRAFVEAACDDWADTGMAVECTEAEDMLVEGRPSEIKRALSNIVDNAVKFAGRAEVSLRREGAMALLVVEDDGPGISESLAKRVFEPFVRGDEARSSTEGFGLGLSIARLIVERHGGSLSLEPATPHGVRAELRLPLARITMDAASKKVEPLLGKLRRSEPSFGG